MAVQRSRSYHRYPRSFYPALFSILLVSLTVFSLITPSYTGFATLTAKNPDSITLLLDKTIYNEGDFITGDVDVALSGPVNEQTSFSAKIGQQEEERAFTEMLNLSNIPFTLSQREMTIEGGLESTTLTFGSKGKQQIFLSVPAGATITQLDMDLHGISFQGTYPTFVRMDIGMDGSYEWEYLGTIINYTDYLLPSGLNENIESTTFIKDEDAYYCEIINLPRAKDFKFFAKYGAVPTAVNLINNNDSDIEAVLLSLSGSGSTVQGLGGADACDLPETINTAASYYSCDLPVTYAVNNLLVSYAIQGPHLVCVHNAESGSGTTDVYNLRRDSDKGVGYRCSSISAQGKTTCVQQLSGDFYIKVQAAVYSGVLDQQIAFAEGYTNQVFESVLNKYVDTCQATNGNCVIPITVSSDGPGVLYLDNLQLRFTEGGSTSEDNNFYSVSFTPGVLSTINGVDLTTGNTTLTLSLDGLDLVAPDPGNKEKNFTFTASLSPGPSDSDVVLVRPTNATGNVTQQPTAVQDLIVFYKGILSQLLSEHGTLLTSLQYQQKITQALQQLTSFERQVQPSNATNGSSSSATLNTQVQNVVQSLPQTITLSTTLTQDALATFSDITDAVLLPDQQDEESKKNIYTLQQSVSLTRTIKVYELIFFDKMREQGTLLHQGISSSFGDGYLVMIVPSSVATTSNDLTFSISPETVQSSNPLIVRWKLSQVSQGVDVLFEDKDITPVLDEIVSLYVPLTIPEEIPEERARCGDGFCTVLTVNGQNIPLEDQYSCPQDCGTSLPWTQLIIVIVLFLLAIFYFGFYNGKYNYHELFGKFKKTSKPGSQKSLFATPNDETNLRAYVAASLKRGVQKTVIMQNLSKQGWTKQQIDYIFSRL